MTQVEIYPESCAPFHIAQVAEPSSISTYEVGKNLLTPTWPWTNPFPKIPIQQPRHRPSIGPSAYVGPQQERGCTGNASDKKTQEEVPHIPKQLLYETSDIIKQHHKWLKKKLKCSFHHFTILQPFSTKAKLSKELSAHGRKPHLTMLNCRTVGALLVH